MAAAKASTTKTQRGRPRTVHPDRDRLAHFCVEWVMWRTGLGVGRGAKDAARHDACIVASWLLSGGKFGTEYMRGHPGAAPLIEAARLDCGVFQWELRGVERLNDVMDQLQRMNARAVRNAYQRHQKLRPRLPSVWQQARHNDRIHRSLSGELLEDAPKPN